MKVLRYIGHTLQDIWQVFALETRRIFSDSGVIMIFFIAGLAYPILFNLIYKEECVVDVPMAVVDESQSDYSRRFIHKLDATPEVGVLYRCTTMGEAQKLMQQRKVNGILYIPRDYGTHLAKMEQARVGLFCDMSTFLYYKSVMLGTNFVMLNEMKDIQYERYSLLGITGERADDLVTPVPYNDVKLYSPGGGFTSFLIPALLILVIHQTLFFGIGMLGGTAREDKIEVSLMPAHLRGRSVYRVTLGRALAYLVVYLGLSAFALLLIPHIFNLPHLGRLSDLVLFLVPFLLATIFFSMTISVLIRHRESGLLTMLFFSIVLLFLSGVAWPSSNMSDFWRLFSYLFPSTHGIQGFVRINSLGATLQQVRFEYIMLMCQVIFYFVTATLSLRYINRHRTLRQMPAGLQERIRLREIRKK